VAVSWGQKKRRNMQCFLAVKVGEYFLLTDEMTMETSMKLRSDEVQRWHRQRNT
jgi:hypothetical protein